MRIKKTSVLVVEDDLLISLLEQRILSSLGYQVLANVTDGVSAITQAQKVSPDLILMDICLSGKMNGIEAAKKIWEFSDVPVVFASGNQDLYLRAYSSLTKNHTFVSKPFSRNSLREALNSVHMIGNSRLISA